MRNWKAVTLMQKSAKNFGHYDLWDNFSICIIVCEAKKLLRVLVCENSDADATLQSPSDLMKGVKWQKMLPSFTFKSYGVKSFLLPTKICLGLGSFPIWVAFLTGSPS